MENTLKDLHNNIELLNESKIVDIYYIYGGNTSVTFSGGYIKLEKGDLTIDNINSYPSYTGGFGKIWKEKIYNNTYKNVIIIPFMASPDSITTLDSSEYKGCVSDSIEHIYCYGYNYESVLGNAYYNSFINNLDFPTVAPNAVYEYRLANP